MLALWKTVLRWWPHVKDCHITGDYWGSAHKECNLNLTITKNPKKLWLSSFISRTWEI